MRLACLALVAACTHPSPADPPSSHAEAAAPATPGPRVTFAGGDFQVAGLPAVASDGSLVVIAHKDSDGARGNPNLTLIARDRSDKVVDRLVVLTSDEAEVNNGVDAPSLAAARAAKAQAWLDEKHRAAHLVALPKLGTTDRAPREQVAGGGAIVHWANSSIAVSDHGAALVTRTTPPTWLAKDHPMCDQCNGEICHNDAFLESAYLDVARTVALVIVNYDGTDTCWEPAAQEHVVAW